MEEIQEKTKINRKFSVIGRNLTIIFSICIVVFFCLATYLSYRELTENRVQLYREKVYECSQFAADCMKGFSFDTITDSQDTQYQSYSKILFSFLKNMKLKYIYAYVPANDGYTIKLIIFLDEYGNQKYKLGEDLDISVEEKVMDVYTGKALHTAVITDNEFGYVVTGYSPVLDNQGNITAVVGVDIDADSIITEMQENISNKVLYILLLSVLILVALLVLNNKYMVSPIHKISQAMEQFVEWHKEKTTFQKLNIDRNDEIGIMAKAFDSMGTELESYLNQIQNIAAITEKSKVQMSIARKIQYEALPKVENEFVNDGRFHLSASMDAAKEVGGDFYDFFYIGENRLCVVIGDVSGKGITGAMFMMRAKTLIKERTIRGEEPNRVLESTNAELCSQNESGMFVTVFMGILDLNTGVFHYSNAGHNPPYLCRYNEKFVEMQPDTACPLGAFEDEGYVQDEITLLPGDRIFFYTDGVNEAEDFERKMFGKERMEKCLNRWRFESVFTTINKLGEEVKLFAHGAKQSDDITMVALQYEGTVRSCWVNADVNNLNEIRKQINSTVKNDDSYRKSLHLIAEEIFVNIVSYTYKGMENAINSLYFSCENIGDRVKMIFIDSGIPFNPLVQQDPDIEKELSDQTEGGYGIYLTKKLSDKIEYVRKDNYNILIIEKRKDVYE